MISVLPNNDEREHVRATDCWCKPDVEWSHPETGAVYAQGPLVVHFAADCRQDVERLLGESIAPDKNWSVIRE